MSYTKWSLFLLQVQNTYSSNREDTGRIPAPVAISFTKTIGFIAAQRFISKSE